MEKLDAVAASHGSGAKVVEIGYVSSPISSDFSKKTEAVDDRFGMLTKSADRALDNGKTMVEDMVNPVPIWI